MPQTACWTDTIRKGLGTGQDVGLGTSGTGAGHHPLPGLPAPPPQTFLLTTILKTEMKFT